LKKKNTDAKSVEAKQQTSTTKVAEEKTFVRSALSWLFVEQTTTASTKTQRGRKSKAT
jgi:hypothetical protein